MKKVRSEPLEHYSNSKEYLIALLDFPSYMKMLDADKKSYKPLIDWLLANKPTYPYHLGNIAKSFDWDGGKLAKYLKAIYNDIVDLNHNEGHLFIKEGQYQCCVSFNYIGYYAAHFDIGLNLIPSVGDSLTFNFIYPLLGGSTFYVKSIGHEINNDGNQTIDMYVTSEYPYLYLQLIKEKAYLNHYISFDEYFKPLHTETERKLLIKVDI